jgi:hypothetical protein
LETFMNTWLTAYDFFYSSSLAVLDDANLTQ